MVDDGLFPSEDACFELKSLVGVETLFVALMLVGSIILRDALPMVDFVAGVIMKAFAGVINKECTESAISSISMDAFESLIIGDDVFMNSVSSCWLYQSTNMND